MRVSRIGWLGVRTDRPGETTGFFRDVLGLSVEIDEPGFTMLRLPGATNDFVEVFGPDDARGSIYPGGASVGFVVDDVREAWAELGSAGVEAIEEGITWSRSVEGLGWFHVRGPDGDVYGIMQGSDPLP